MKIAVIGLGYVGLSNAILFSEHHTVFAYDIDIERVRKLEDKESPIKDVLIQSYLRERPLDIHYYTRVTETIEDAEFIIIATPTNFNDVTNKFDTNIVESNIEEVIKYNKSGMIIIKSTVPVGFTNMVQEKYNCSRIVFSPEFLREGKALYDNLYPSRIVVGYSDKSEKFANELRKLSLKDNTESMIVSNSEAEAIKLFSNTYLAMRISYFNELDTYSELNNLDSKNVIKGISLDPRIGDYYNNPSFGYGGYCLPKDSKQVLSNFENIPNSIMNAIVESNKLRKMHISSTIDNKSVNCVGIYKLIMKKDSDNFRDSAILDVMRNLSKSNKSLIVFEPLLNMETIEGVQIIKDFNEFINLADIVVANRVDEKIYPYRSKVYTRDLFNRD